LHIPTDQLVAALVAISFAAGLNVYATLATLGLLSHFGVFPLPPGLHLLGSWYVIAASVALFAIEFVADKIPYFDLIWNALHTFVRVPLAALVAYRATATLSPWEQILATTVGGGIALAAHGGKTAARAAVTPSPEPVSNSALSVGEDVVAVSLTWFATKHPYMAAGLALILVVIVVALIRWVVRALRALFRGAERRLSPGTHELRGDSRGPSTS
jgi:hypothetical protein